MWQVDLGQTLPFKVLPPGHPCEPNQGTSRLRVSCALPKRGERFCGYALRPGAERETDSISGARLGRQKSTLGHVARKRLRDPEWIRNRLRLTRRLEKTSAKWRSNLRVIMAYILPRCTAAPIEPSRALSLPMVQATQPLPACDPCPACVSAQSSDEHRGGGVGGTRVQRPAERGVGGTFCRTVGPRLQAARHWGMRAARKQCPRDAWMSRLRREANHARTRAGPRRVARVSLRAVARSTVARGCRLLRPRACDAK